MKKLLTSICILLLSCIYCAAEGNTRLYCVCNQEWWNADDAAIAIYAYSEGGVNNAEWPGERMTKTEEFLKLIKENPDLLVIPAGGYA